MKRMLPAIIASVLITSFLIYLMVQLIEFDDRAPTSSKYVRIQKPIELTTTTTKTESQLDLDCEILEKKLKDQISVSQSCSVDSDCELAHLGCPFGCVTALTKSLIPKLTKMNQNFRSLCIYCVYSCRASIFERRAACRRGTCVVVEDSVEDPVEVLKRDTLELLNES